ncbi:MAG TPA: tetratricopeptide repeat protein [Syntrophorhabdaceae bacterium]|nr:tetratricopeptide repeat protein [Syntrophorhabdaceae bacterium]
MKIYRLHPVVLLTAVLLLTAALPAAAAENPKDRLDYWQKNFDELKPEDDARAKKAHEIFARVLSAAGKRPGVTPRLFIVKSEAAYIPLAIAIPDGGVIISKKVLDICYKDAKYGDDRLAFILGHEIAHQLKDDFWHMKFFQAVEISQGKDAGKAAVLNEVKSIAGATENVLAKELQADEHGIIYASLAGFNTASIVTEDNRVNFFEYVAKSMDPGNIKGMKKDGSHPAPAQRAETVKARLRQVLEKVEVFNLGVLFYQTEDYRRALIAFEEFLRYFPSREVYHNVAACHHQLALKHYRAWQGDKDPLPFQLSLSIDPVTLASKITLRGRGAAPTPEALFRDHLAKAIENYEKATALDPSYFLSYNNLGCAYVLKGEPYKAIAVLKDALKLSPNNKEALNNLGVAFFIAENPQKAKENLLSAQKLDPAYDAPLFNLGKIAREEKNEAEEKKYWAMYLKLGPAGLRADTVRKLTGEGAPAEQVKKSSVRESVGGLRGGADVKEIPQPFGKPVTSLRVRLEEAPFVIERFSNGLMVVSQDGEVLLAYAGEGSQNRTSRNISAGSREDEVLERHGKPYRVQATRDGKNMIYKEQGVSFRIRGGKVVSWLVY